MSWNLEGQRVHGLYLDLFPYAGVVSESRVKYGGTVQHTVELDETITVFGALRNHVLVSGNEITGVLKDVEEV